MSKQTSWLYAACEAIRRKARRAHPSVLVGTRLPYLTFHEMGIKRTSKTQIIRRARS